MYSFRYPRLWLAIGLFGIALLVVLSLLPVMVALPVSNGDKLGHLLAYTVLMGWFAQILRTPGLLVAVALGLLGLGVGLEFLQQYTGRYFEYRDMLANTLGIALGLLFGRLLGCRLLQALEQRLPG